LALRTALLRFHPWLARIKRFDVCEIHADFCAPAHCFAAKRLEQNSIPIEFGARFGSVKIGLNPPLFMVKEQYQRPL
jgi:hypothetical protein